jgi:predicted dehydrogenase
MPFLTRRAFLKASAAASTFPALAFAGAADSPNERHIVAVMGVRNRGRDLLRGFSAFDDVEIAYICEVDANMVPAAMKSISARQKRTPRVEKDVRKVLEDKNVTALAVAAPDHWHALATIWACQAGKHVYVEKPISHNLIEGRRMVEAARKYNRVVQVGTQRRSAGNVASAREFVRSGKLGKVPFARAWIAGDRKSIGHKSDSAVPEGVDYDLWLGPAPERAFNANRFHYNWHWFWDYGTGELGNNGIHGLDVARHVLGLEAPSRVTCGGGKYFYDDDQQTPDTQIATFDFPGTSLVWEHRIWAKAGLEGASWGVALHGEKGTLIFGDRGWRVADGVEGSDKSSDDMGQKHIRNFLDCVASGKRPNADIEEGHKSTRLCHLGNIAYRAGRTLHFDAATETIQGDADANALLGRAYRKPFVVPAAV